MLDVESKSNTKEYDTRLTLTSQFPGKFPQTRGLDVCRCLSDLSLDSKHCGGS